jgi:diacylglycerol kinase
LKEKFSISNRIKGFGHALNGLGYFIKHTHNLPIYLVTTTATIFIAIYFEIKTNEWLWITTAILITYIAEIFNSSIEKVVDKASPESSELAKHSKDMAAAAVLVTALLSALIGIIIFYPYFIHLF